MIDFELDIAAPAATVFALFTEPDGLARWMVDAAEVDLRPDGRFRWRYHNGDVVSGRFVEIDAPRRLSFRYGWEHPADRGVPPDSTTVEVTFTERDGMTRLRLVHTGVPPAQEPAHHGGWQTFLRALARTADTSRVTDRPGAPHS